MSDFLLEILSEEIPARMQAKARADLARLFEAELNTAGLSAQGIETYVTPRRLVLIARGLPQETAATSEELKGPRTSAPPQALEGFLRKTGLSQDQLSERDGIWFANLEKPGRATVEVLAEAIPAIVRAFPWPKSMRWGAASLATESLRWVRPLQGIVAMLDEKVVDFEIGDVRSGAATIGHRFRHPGPITLGGASDYLEKLKACHVIVDQDERARIIRDGAAAAASAAGLTLVEDEGLVLENAGLTEWPVPLLGQFDPSFLQVPREVIQLTMRTNQKYFAATDGQGALAPAFICVANIDAADGGQAIVHGNQKVLAARLSDAKFFWEHDLAVPLGQQAEKLSQIVFHEKLGTVADKVDRVAKLARWLVEEGIVGTDANLTARPERSRGAPAPALEPRPSTTLGTSEVGQLADLAERAARLAKADLVTQMVGEFPELQGLIGGYIAAAQDEDPQVAEAIRDHYKPVGQGDEVPTAPVTVAVSLADKFDTLVSFFYADMPPTGSKDPFALRRAALGVLELLTHNSLRLSLWEGITHGLKGMTDLRVFPEMPDQAFEAHSKAMQATFKSLPDFFADRLKVQQREAGVRHDLIDAVFALGGEDDLVRLLARVRALQSFVETPDGTDLLAGYKRAANILKKENWTAEQDENKTLSYTPENAEDVLIAALDSAEPEAAAAVEREDFEGAMRALATLRRPVDAFFNEVTVNDPDPAKREARLDLLARMRAAVHRVADFSRIEG
ncbi:glycine--tRNA ligase subunit beta [Sphingosinicella sp. YJ22]|uniref:glycine--tRNA ligase subunit beta n=1 Tax=Sphingosinicella sp. YJ22 TaxID=1104780 RepID=UPI00140890D6|nr:glycine--tRNA ligase subunit beta [Sphingosinicella sp. YJ22]